MSTDDPAAARAQARARTAALLEARFGPHWRARLGRALGLTQPAVSRTFSPPAGRTDRPSPALQALAEILAVTPDEKLPPRWGATREDPAMMTLTLRAPSAPDGRRLAVRGSDVLLAQPDGDGSAVTIRLPGDHGQMMTVHVTESPDAVAQGVNAERG